MSCSSLLSALNDDQFSIPHKKVIPQFSIFERLVLAVKTFFTFTEIDKKSRTFKTDENTKKLFEKVRSEKLTGHYTSDIEIPFEVIRKLYKRYDNMTFNDYMLAILGKSLYQYCIKKDIKNPKGVKCEVPVGHKKLPTGYHDINISNYLSVLELELPIVDSIREGYDTLKPYVQYLLQPEIQKQ